MDQQRKKEVIIYSIVAVIVLVIAVGYFAGWFNPAGSGSRTAVSMTSDVPPGTVAPGVNATGTPPDVAIPKVVIPAAPGVAAQFRTFDISAKGGLFAPSTVIVNEGDTVHVNFTAVDKAYDITIPDFGLKQTAAKGETKVLEFQANKSGKFVYYCELCGNSSSSPDGYLIVVPSGMSDTSS